MKLIWWALYWEFFVAQKDKGYLAALWDRGGLEIKPDKVTLMGRWNLIKFVHKTVKLGNMYPTDIPVGKTYAYRWEIHNKECIQIFFLKLKAYSHIERNWDELS